MKNATDNPIGGRNAYKRIWVRMGVALLASCLIIALGAWYFVLRPMEESRRAALEQSQIEQLYAQGDKLRAERKFDEAAAKFKDYAKFVRDTGKKQDALMRAATMYESKGDAKAALATYKEAERIHDTDNVGVVMGIARTAVATGDKKEGAKYYRKAGDLLKEQGQMDYYNAYYMHADTLEQSK